MEKKITIFIVFLAIIGCSLFFYNQKTAFFSYSALMDLLESKERICFKDNCYFVEIAKSVAEREKGLMQRDNLEADKGMLFIFEKEGIYPFWMKNMKFPIDIIWLDKEMKAAYIYKNAQPCASECPNIIPDKMAQYILEISAGEAEKIGLKDGSIFVLK